MHKFPTDTICSLPENFNDPFRYSPHPLVAEAAKTVMKMMKKINPSGEGKMLGVLLVRNSSGELGYLAGFSGNINGKNNIDGFVPPIYDLLDPDGLFKKEEGEISRLNAVIRELTESPERSGLNDRLTSLRTEADADLASFKDRMTARKKEREKIRSATADPDTIEALTRESQHDKADFRRRKSFWKEKEEALLEQIRQFDDHIEELRKERASRSDSLQQWIFGRYMVSNALGEKASIKDIFASKGLAAPGGTGECAAPKLLQQAYMKGLEPVAMGEFWYGMPSATAVRTHGHFYPSCTSKCGPLLEFMLKGIRQQPQDTSSDGRPHIIYEDNSLAVVSKPSGMPSVPGLDGRLSMLEWLDSEGEGTTYIPVHRLDMDTSGIMIYAKDENAARNLRMQFERHTIIKEYLARLSPADIVTESWQTPHEILKEGAEGIISFPLSPDYDERPRQKADIRNGKEAVTGYQVVRSNADGTTDIIFRPVTGRTHQLRVHAAHTSGLSRPILGDLLYGGQTAHRLHLHSNMITFLHPESNEEMAFETLVNCYPIK